MNSFARYYCNTLNPSCENRYTYGGVVNGREYECLTCLTRLIS